MMKIIPTLTVMKTDKEYEDMIINFVNSNSDIFRCNATRFDNDIYIESIQRLQKIHRRVASRPFKLLLDIPCPKDKIRVSYDEKTNDLEIRKNEMFVLQNEHTSYKDDKKYIYVETDFDGILEKETFILGDGEIVVEVIERIGKSQLLCKSKNGGMLGYGKACYLKKQYCEYVTKEKECNYKSLIEQLEPEFIALSFVESADDILRIKEWLSKKIKIVAKIETRAGAYALNEIIEEADAIMIGRGDLALTAGYENLYSLQNNIIKNCKNRGMQVMVATDILNTLCEKQIPSRAEVCDLSQLAECEVDNVVLSGPLCRYEQYNLAAHYVEQICNMKKPNDYN